MLGLKERVVELMKLVGGMPLLVGSHKGSPHPNKTAAARRFPNSHLIRLATPIDPLPYPSINPTQKP
jgi:hypothetical protein